MLKGCQRRIIMVKDTGSRFFDSAYFVIKSDLPRSARDSDMLAEAHRMIDAYSSAEAPQNVTEAPRRDISSKKHIGAWIVIGGIMLSLAGISAAVTLIMLLF